VNITEACSLSYDAFVLFTLFIYAAVLFTLGWMWCDWYQKAKIAERMSNGG
jgi:hypothetical protein